MDQHTAISTWVASSISTVAIISSILGWAPQVGALVAAIWYLIKIYESATVQRWVRDRARRKLARLRERVLILEAKYLAQLPPPGEKPDGG
jgi:hypothetical protein